MRRYRVLCMVLIFVMLFGSRGVFADILDNMVKAEKDGSTFGEISGRKDFKDGLISNWKKAIPFDDIEIAKRYGNSGEDNLKVVKAFKDAYQIAYEKAYNVAKKDKEKEEKEAGSTTISGLGASLGMIYGEIAGFKDFESRISSNWSRSMPRQSNINNIFDLRKLPTRDKNTFMEQFTANYQLGYEKAYYSAHFGTKKDNMTTGRIDGTTFGTMVGKVFGDKDYYENRDSDFNRNIPTDSKITTEYSLNRDNSDYLEGFINGFKNSYEESYVKSFREAKNNVTLLEDSSAYENGNTVGQAKGKVQASMDNMEKKSNDWKRSQALTSTIIMEYNLVYQTPKYRDGFINGYWDGYSNGYASTYKELSQTNAMSKTTSETVAISGGSIISLDKAFTVEIDKGIYYKPVILTIESLNDMYSISSRYISASNFYRLSMTNPSGDLNNKKKIKISFEYYGDKDGGIYKLEGSKWHYLTSTIEDDKITAYINPNNVNSSGNIFVVLVDKETTVLHDIRGHWAKDEITAYIRRGVISGFPDKTFKPDQYITRAEFLVLLSRLYEWYLPPDTTNVKFFKDNETFRYSEKYISYGLSNKYIIGYPDKYFRPYNNITYKEVDIIMKSVLNDPSFKWANYAEQMMYDKKVRSKSYDSVHGNITRAEFSYMLYSLNQWRY